MGIAINFVGHCIVTNCYKQIAGLNIIVESCERSKGRLMMNKGHGLTNLKVVARHYLVCI